MRDETNDLIDLGAASAETMGGATVIGEDLLTVFRPDSSLSND